MTQSNRRPERPTFGFVVVPKSEYFSRRTAPDNSTDCTKSPRRFPTSGATASAKNAVLLRWASVLSVGLT